MLRTICPIPFVDHLAYAAVRHDNHFAFKKKVEDHDTGCGDGIENLFWRNAFFCFFPGGFIEVLWLINQRR